MGGGLEADLTEGAVPALWSARPAAVSWARWRPVLQVADVRHVPDDGTGLRPAPAQCQRYRLLLSDGAYSQRAELAPALNHLASGGALRCGSVIRLLSFVKCTPGPDFVRTILISKLEVLQTECALIGSLKLYKPPRNSGSGLELQSTTMPIYTWSLDSNSINSDCSDPPQLRALHQQLALSAQQRPLPHHHQQLACLAQVQLHRCAASAYEP